VTQNTPIILLTSLVMPDELVGYQQLDVVGVITKPFDPEYLGYDIAQLLGRPTTRP
jgi:CheY-like chemotaxis protein